MRKTIWLHIGLLFLVWLLFVWVGVAYLDNDFGWHLQTGELIRAEGLPTTDPFSFTMPSYSFVAHSWLQDVLIASLYPKFGLLGLSLFYSTIAILSLVLAIPRGINNKWFPVVLLFTFPLLLMRFAVRVQVFSWFFTACILRILWSDQTWQQRKKWLPLVMWLWAMVHGSFLLGLMLLGCFMGLRFWQQRKLTRAEMVLVILSILVTLLTPYFLKLWAVSWSILTTSQGKEVINEWRPIFSGLTELGFAMAVGLTSVLLVKQQHRFSRWQQILYLGVVLAALFSTRHGAILAVVTGPMLVWGLDTFVQDQITTAGRRKNAQQVFKVLGLISMVLVALGLYLPFRQRLTTEQAYPQHAVAWLKANPFEGNLFSLYGWGGYLIWQYPEKKTFIDGRMDVWQRQQAPPLESLSALEEYLKVTTEGEYQEIFAKYGVRTVLLPSEFNLSPKHKLPFNLSFLRNELAVSFIDVLQTDGWQVVYQDDTAVILREPN